LLVDGTESAVLVVRGSTDAGDLPPLAAGPVSVTGVVAPSEPFSTAVGRGRRIESVNVSVLVGSVPYDLYSVYVVRTAQSPPDPAQLDPVAVSLPEASWTAGARNLAYGIQWWVFAAFTTFMWWRVVVCSGPLLRWLAEDGSTLWQVGDFIQNRVSPVHGFLYMVFLVSAAILSRQAAWPLSFTVVTMLLGTVPILSFVAERRATARTLQSTAGVRG
jgi:integral membrane protein